MPPDLVRHQYELSQELTATLDLVADADGVTRVALVRRLLNAALSTHPVVIARRKALLDAIKSDQRAAERAKKQAQRDHVAKERADAKAFKHNVLMSDKRSQMRAHNEELKRRYDNAVIQHTAGMSMGIHPPRKPKYLEIPAPTPLCSDYVDPELADLVWDEPE
jgi:hypothetical protein